ncbi:MAG TPA: CopG family transcriptional regulator [Candidatus Woesebacteria bacterium]|nr:CopG family transcriptional regulator [Candidatus Woesebacteria bacterium]
MKKSIKQDNKIYKGTHGNLKLLVDFLPSPEEFVRKNTNRKVTIALSDVSIDFFKTESKKLKTPYQRLIRDVLQEYVNHMTQTT